MIQADVNGDEYQFHLEETDQGFTLENDLFEADVLHVRGRQYHLLHDNKSYRVELVDVQKEEKSLTLLVNGHEYTVQVQDQYDRLLEQLGMADIGGAKVNEIKAPMPGLVLSIDVEEGDEVEKDQGVVVLEAMKMENVIKTVDEGTVKTIHVGEQEKVEKNQLLIELE